MTRILIVDDQQTIQRFLESYFEVEDDIEVIGFAHNGQAAIDKVTELKPDVVIMDIEMPVMDGLSATREIVQQSAKTKVIMFTSQDNEKFLNIAVKVGAKGYLLKNTPPEEVIKAVRSVAKGYFQLGPGLLEGYLEKIIQSQSYSSEIVNFKTAIGRQSQLLEKINKEFVSHHILDERLDNRQLVTDIQDLKFEFITLKRQVDKLNKKSSLTRKLLLISLILIFNIFLISLLTVN